MSSMNSETQASRVVALVNRKGSVAENGITNRLQLSSARKNGFQRLLERRAAAMAQIDIPDISDVYQRANSRQSSWESSLNPFADIPTPRGSGG